MTSPLPAVAAHLLLVGWRRHCCLGLCAGHGAAHPQDSHDRQLPAILLLLRRGARHDGEWRCPSAGGGGSGGGVLPGTLCWTCGAAVCYAIRLQASPQAQGRAAAPHSDGSEGSGHGSTLQTSVRKNGADSVDGMSSSKPIDRKKWVGCATGQHHWTCFNGAGAPCALHCPPELIVN